MLDQSTSMPLDWVDTLSPADIQTPAFVYNADAVNARIAGLKDALGTDVIISFKASNQLDLLMRLEPENYDGIEVASRGELHLIAGRKGPDIFINTPALNEQLVRSGISAEATFIVDTPEHLDMIARLKGKRTVHPVSLRLSNKIIADVCPQAPTLRDDQFGMDMPQALAAVEKAKELGLQINGLHLYAGPHTFRKAARFVVETMKVAMTQIEEALGHDLEVLNLGGGLEENWPDLNHDFDGYRALLGELPSRCRLIHEFGRAIFSDCGIFAVRVQQVKHVMGQPYAICDGGMAQAFLLAQTEHMMRKYRQPRLLGRAGDVREDGLATIVCGSTCSRDDVIGKIPAEVKAGDVLIFEDCGAYTRTYSMNNFLQLGEAGTYVV